MGYMRHHAIIVTGFRHEDLLRALKKAKTLFPKQRISQILKADVNMYETLFISTDGSKEGWAESDAGDLQREAFINWLRCKKQEDCFYWAEVRYTDDEGKTLIERDNVHPEKEAD
jgi:hypothetical protein